MRRRGRGLAALALLIGAAPMWSPSVAQEQGAVVLPDFAIWDVKLGEPVTVIPDSVAAIIACGTNGGPISIELTSFAEWEKCTPEASGLREISFTYDDEKDYIARAMELEYRSLQGGTSAYAHPIVPSILVDDKGVTQGIRIITDDRASDADRRVAVVLSKNLKARYGAWNLDCEDIPMQAGEQPVGGIFIHDRCTGADPDGSGRTVLIQGSYLRKKGQEGLNLETQQVNKGYYESESRLEVLNPPYLPSEGT